MTTRKASQKAYHKTRTVGVRLSDDEFAEVAKLADRETARRREVVHEAALLRELVMPRVRELLAADVAA